jgi:hypothetical protein
MVTARGAEIGAVEMSGVFAWIWRGLPIESSEKNLQVYSGSPSKEKSYRFGRFVLKPVHRGRPMLKIGLIIGSTRPNRFADNVAPWVVEGARARSDLSLTVLDLRDYRLPFFNEPAPPSYAGGIYTEAKAETWRKRVGEFDAFVAIVAEYNHGPTAVLKNAFDSAFLEWNANRLHLSAMAA